MLVFDKIDMLMVKQLPTILLFILLAATVALAGFSRFDVSGWWVDEALFVTSTTTPPRLVFAWQEKTVNIPSGATFTSVMQEAGVKDEIIRAVYNAAFPLYDLAKIRAGTDLHLFFSRLDNKLKKLVYPIDSEEELVVEYQPNSSLKEATTSDFKIASLRSIWQVERRPIPYEIKLKVAEGTIKTSMYEAALESNIDIRAIIALANTFQWSIDFALDPRQGDTFKFIYEERYLEGKYIMPGRVLAGRYVNQGQPLEVFYFEEDEKNKGYFDADGNSVQKMFLRAPVAFKYISSGFTTGKRYVKAFNTYTGHRAIDYAAPYGTPIRAVGDGVVTFAGWAGPYGRKTTIRHNATYSTNYAHQSKIIVRRGQRVKQGQIIGYVGSSGFSTGPHVHYEMVKNGVKVNPYKEALPPGKPIKEENRERFFAQVAKYRQLLQ